MSTEERPRLSDELTEDIIKIHRFRSKYGGNVTDAVWGTASSKKWRIYYQCMIERLKQNKLTKFDRETIFHLIDDHFSGGCDVVISQLMGSCPRKPIDNTED